MVAGHARALFLHVDGTFWRDPESGASDNADWRSAIAKPDHGRSMRRSRGHSAWGVGFPGSEDIGARAEINDKQVLMPYSATLALFEDRARKGPRSED